MVDRTEANIACMVLTNLCLEYLLLCLGSIFRRMVKALDYNVITDFLFFFSIQKRVNFGCSQSVGN
jgi:hypothetical protein